MAAEKIHQKHNVLKWQYIPTRLGHIKNPSKPNNPIEKPRVAKLWESFDETSNEHRARITQASRAHRARRRFDSTSIKHQTCITPASRSTSRRARRHLSNFRAAPRAEGQAATRAKSSSYNTCDGRTHMPVSGSKTSRRQREALASPRSHAHRRAQSPAACRPSPFAHRLRVG